MSIGKDTGRTRRRLALRWPAVIAAAVLLVYHGSFQGPFVLDDLAAIADNPTLRSLWPLSDVFSPPASRGETVGGRPLLNLTFALNWLAGGGDVRGFHAVNLVFHLLTAWGLFGVLRRAFSRCGPSLAPAADNLAGWTALLWSIHPLATAAVTYIVQRAESLAALLGLAVLWLFLRSLESRRPRWWLVASVLVCWAGMATKETMAAAPWIVLLFDRQWGAGSFRQALRRRRVYYTALGSAWLLLGWLIWSTRGRGGSAGLGLEVLPWDYALTQCWAIVRYLCLAFWPHLLVFDYGMGLERSLGAVWPQALLLVALLAATGVAIWRRHPAGCAGAVFFLWLAPSSSVVPVITQTVAEHRMYLPLAAVLAVGVALAWRIMGRRALWFAAPLALSLAAVTVVRNHDYSDAVALWRDTVAKRPANTRAWQELALALAGAGQRAEALAAFAEALRLEPVYPVGHCNYASVLLDAGRVREAFVHYVMAVRQRPELAEAWYGLGLVETRRGNARLAAAAFAEAIRRRPNFPNAINNLGSTLASLGRVDEAIAHYREALRLRPDFARAHANLGNLLAHQGHLREALMHYEAVLRLDPAWPGAQVNAGLLRSALTKADGGK